MSKKVFSIRIEHVLELEFLRSRGFNLSRFVDKAINKAFHDYIDKMSTQQELQFFDVSLKNSQL